MDIQENKTEGMAGPDPAMSSPPEENSPGFLTRPSTSPVLDMNTQIGLTGMEPHDSFLKRNKWFIIISIISLLVIAVLAFFALRSNPVDRAEEAKLQFNIVAPESVKSADSAVFQINLENKDTEALKNMQLELVLPAGATVTESTSEAQNGEKTLYRLPDLSVGRSVQFFVKVKLAGNSGEEVKVEAILHYQFASSRLEFKKSIESSVLLSQAGVDLSIVGPSTTTLSQLVIYNIKYKNNSGEAVSNARINLTLPERFTLESSEPEATSGKNTWDVGKLDPGQEGEIIFQGTFDDLASGASPNFEANMQLPNTGSGFYSVASTNFITKITSFPIQISIDATGVSNAAVDPGQRINFVVAYKNTTDVTQEAVTVTADLSGKAYDLTAVEAEGADVQEGKITWNAAATAALEKIEPGKGGQLNFSVPIKNPPTKDSTKNLIVKAKPTISSKAHQGGFPGNELTLKVNSYFKPSSVISYTGGSLPPVVGKVSTYKVMIQVKSGTNDLKDGLVSFFLPLPKGSVVESSISSTEGTKAAFDSVNSKMTWQLQTIPAFAGTFGKAYSLSFTVNITPTATMKGKEVQILKDILTKATDSFTSKDFSVKLDNQTTSNAEGASGGNGTVQ